MHIVHITEHTYKYTYVYVYTRFPIIILQIIEIKSYLHDTDITLGIINSLEILQSM